jgi:hypothetical protein
MSVLEALKYYGVDWKGQMLTAVIRTWRVAKLLLHDEKCSENNEGRRKVKIRQELAVVW